MKRIILGLASVLCVLTLFLLLKKPMIQSGDDILTMGTVGGYAPFVSVNEKGQYEGFDIDIAHELAKKIDKKLVLKDLGSMTGLLMALEQGSIDAVIWGLSITQERLEKIAMVRYQGEVTKSYPMLFWQKIPASISSIADMRGMTVCVEPNSSQESVLKTYDFITIKPTDRVDDALLDIQYGKADAAFVEPAIGNKFKKKYPQIQTLNVDLALKNQVQGVGIAIRKDNTAIIDTIQRAIEQLKMDGAIQAIEKKWGIV